MVTRGRDGCLAVCLANALLIKLRNFRVTLRLFSTLISMRNFPGQGLSAGSSNIDEDLSHLGANCLLLLSLNL